MARPRLAVQSCKNNVADARSLVECAVAGGVPRFVFSSTAVVYGNPARIPITEGDAAMPISPYGSSKLMTETMLRDTSAAHAPSHAILRYFNVAGADPGLRTGQSTRNATHLIKVAVETAIGQRAKMEVFGTDYPTDDGTCVRDYISAPSSAIPSPGRESLQCGMQPELAVERRGLRASALTSESGSSSRLQARPG